MSIVQEQGHLHAKYSACKNKNKQVEQRCTSLQCLKHARALFLDERETRFDLLQGETTTSGTFRCARDDE